MRMIADGRDEINTSVASSAKLPWQKSYFLHQFAMHRRRVAA
jgi:hypothetical protein